MNLRNLLVYCVNRRCGDPIPRTHNNYAKQPMIFAGVRVGGTAVYMCPSCGRKRYFSQSLFGEVKETTGDCFVACTVYQSVDAPQVETLRKFRDELLVHHPLGRIFVKSYYSMLGPAAVRLTNLSGPRAHSTVRWLLDQLVAALNRRLGR